MFWKKYTKKMNEKIVKIRYVFKLELLSVENKADLYQWF